MLECADGTFYCGSTKNLANRLRLHNEGVAAIWTRGRRPVRLVYFEVLENLALSRKREAEAKKMTRKQKEELMSGQQASQKLNSKS